VRRCGNNCQLTINTLPTANSLSGNRCDRPITGKADSGERNLYAYKRKLILGYKPVPGSRGKIGLPLCLNFWELLPFWHTFFTKLGFAVYHSPLSSRDLYLKGQGTIPSDTACFPASWPNGHIHYLSKLGLDAIFYPCMTYIWMKAWDNHYNCPVVAYYPEVLAGNCPELRETRFIYDYVGIHRPRTLRKRPMSCCKSTSPVSPRARCGRRRTRPTPSNAHHMSLVRKEGERIMDQARAEGRRIIVLAGRPYHVDPRSTTALTPSLPSSARRW
jgi:predicted nucleotide-binding protein (sugar kinase/HSP70/actin superfamily)